MHKNVVEIKALTGLRGILALWVFLLHVMLLLTLGLKLEPFNIFGSFLSKIAWSGYLSVDIFFMLSGFIIYHVYAEKIGRSNLQDKLKFIVARFARIYPVHLAMILLLMLLVWQLELPLNSQCFPPIEGSTCNSFSLSNLFRNLSLTQAWGWFPQNSWNPNSWSVSSEWFAYLLFLLLAPVVVKLPNQLNCLFYLLLLLAAMIVIISQAGDAETFYNSLLKLISPTYSARTLQYLIDNDNKLALEFGLIRASLGFVSGCFLYKLYLAIITKPINWHILGLLSITSIILLIQSDNSIWAYFFMPIIILWLAIAKPLRFKFLESKFMMWCGKISYSFYMTHVFFMKLLVGVLTKKGMLNSDAIAGSSNSFIFIIFLLVFSILVATFFYYLIENPCRLIIGKLCR